ncbi:MAG: hypothetical protein M3N52_08395 [Actinomycetota bacterium]|nr:hypothetical protein [Actinomycetota bacterium]
MELADQCDGDRDQQRVEERAQLLPEESKVHSADPEGQAAAILRESEERGAEAERDAVTGEEPIERRRSPG